MTREEMNLYIVNNMKLVAVKDYEELFQRLRMRAHLIEDFENRQLHLKVSHSVALVHLFLRSRVSVLIGITVAPLPWWRGWVKPFAYTGKYLKPTKKKERKK